jgi:hypothetical protein
MEDNSAVVTMANNDSGYTKKCKHFLMVLNYIKEQIALGQIEARKIYGKLNTADMHTKPLRSSEFLSMAHKILGQPAHVTSQLLLYSTDGNSVLFHGHHGCEEPTKQRDEAITVDRFRTHAQLQATQGTHPLLYYSFCFGMRTYMSPQSDCTAV